MRNPLFAAAIAGATLMLVPAHAEVTIEKVYDGRNGWLTEYIHSDDEPGTDRNELADLCHIQGRITKNEANFIDIAIAVENGSTTGGVSFNSAKYNLQKGPMGEATIDIDGKKFTGAAKGRKHVVSIGLSSQGFLFALLDGKKLVATLPGVKPNIWTLGVEGAGGSLDAMVECVKQHMDKNAFEVL